MKKFIIISVIIVAIIAAAVAGLLYFNSFHKVSVTLSDDVTSATLYKIQPQDSENHQVTGTELQKINAAAELSLQNGDYYFVPDGDKISKTAIYFTVNDEPVSVQLHPGYSNEYLAELLKQEEPAIKRTVQTRFPSDMQNYQLQNGALYEKGDWYGALLVSTISDPNRRSQQDYYRIILHKSEGVWHVTNIPQLVLTSAEFKDVPADILRDVNELTP